MSARTLLPLNASAEEKALDQLAAERLGMNVRPADTNPATCPKSLLPWLAWAWRVDISNLITARQRDLIAKSIELHRYKGAIHSVRQGLRMAGYGKCDIQEGLDARYYDGAIKYDGTHYYGPNAGNWAKYRVFLKQPVSISQAAMIKRLLQGMAPARCHLVSLHYTRALNLYNGKIRYDGQWTYGLVKQVDLI